MDCLTLIPAWHWHVLLRNEVREHSRGPDNASATSGGGGGGEGGSSGRRRTGSHHRATMASSTVCISSTPSLILDNFPVAYVLVSLLPFLLARCS